MKRIKHFQAAINVTILNETSKTSDMNHALKMIFFPSVYIKKLKAMSSDEDLYTVNILLAEMTPAPLSLLT